VKLKISPEAARILILSIPHKTCAKALADHWRVRPDGSVATQSILWLFCWAKTGMNSAEARLVAAQVFDQLLPIAFNDCDRAIDHEYARKYRYSQLDIDLTFERLLARL
jgi:hypothetical protein